MPFSYLETMPLEKAKALFLNALKAAVPIPKTEWIETKDADGRITANAVYAKISAPHYLASAMDGIAVSSKNTFKASETTPVILPLDSVTVVDTGDPIPKDKDAVIMIEEVTKIEGGMKIYAAATPWQHIRQIGEDMSAGDMILPSYTEITPAAQGALLAGGVLKLEVIQKPQVAILPTGDELVYPSADVKAGEIIEFNSTIFSSLLKRWGCDVTVFPILKDNPQEITKALEKAKKSSDVILLSAGSSAGRDDYSARCISEVGEVLCHGVAMKPGKPVVLGMADTVAIMGTPGYPVSAVLALEEIMKPVIDWLSGKASNPQKATIEASVSRPIPSSLKYQEFIRTRLGYVENHWTAAPLPRSAGVISSLVKADGMLKIPQNSEGYPAKSNATIEPFYAEENLKNTLVIIGSHDPLLDEIADIVKRENRSARISSTHVGSTGGILAILGHEAHIAGIHLLDAKTGIYNVPFLQKYFDKEDVLLLRGVGRTQGFMLQKGNPLKIQSILDITKINCRYVNRQGGSGTRILLDYLLQKENIKKDDINGYTREELTHTAVAAQIASGSADAGLGILSAAKIYDLDFLPICTEHYDFLILKSAYDLEQTQNFIRILKSDTLKERLEKMGGYTFENVGEIIPWN